MKEVEIWAENDGDTLVHVDCAEDDDTDTENFLLITVKNREVIGDKMAVKMEGPPLPPLSKTIQDLLKKIKPLKKISIVMQGTREKPQNDLFFYCFLDVISSLPFIPVEYLIVHLAQSDQNLDDVPLLEALQKALLNPNTSLKYLELGILSLLEYKSLQIIGEMLVHPDCRLQGLSFGNSSFFHFHIARWITEYLGQARLRLLELTILRTLITV